MYVWADGVSLRWRALNKSALLADVIAGVVFVDGEKRESRWNAARIRGVLTTCYANNPRDNDAAVAAVAASIQTFGWQQPLVVDEDDVIIVGNTRWKAAKQLGLTEVPVHVARGLTPAQVRPVRKPERFRPVTPQARSFFARTALPR